MKRPSTASTSSYVAGLVAEGPVAQRVVLDMQAQFPVNDIQDVPVERLNEQRWHAVRLHSPDEPSDAFLGFLLHFGEDDFLVPELVERLAVLVVHLAERFSVTS